MARFSPQNNAVAPYKAPAPTGFDDNLKVRAFPHRFRRIGSPFAYLNDIGIEAILEYIIKGHLLVEVAEATNVPFRRLQEWVVNEGYMQLVDEAETQSAEGVMSQARKAIREAPTDFELRRAKLMLAHAEWMATKKNKTIYGENKTDKGGGGGVTYEFHINGVTNVAATTSDIIEATAVRHTDLIAGFDPSRMLATLPVLDDPTAELEPVLVAERPLVPTPEQPDIGPFFDGIDEVIAL